MAEFNEESNILSIIAVSASLLWKRQLDMKTIEYRETTTFQLCAHESLS